MRWLVLSLGIVSVLLLGCLSNSYAQSPAPRMDVYGDPMPDSVLFRFGSVRYRTAGGIDDGILSPDEKLFAVSAMGTVHVFEMATGKRIHTFSETGTSMLSGMYSGHKLAFSPDSKFLFCTSGYDVSVRVWNMETGKQEYTLGNKPKRPNQGFGLVSEDSHLFLMPDGKTLYTYENNTLQQWDLTKKKTVDRKEPIQARGTIALFSPDGKQFISFNQNGNNTTYFIQETATGKDVGTVDVQTNGNFGYRKSLAYSHDMKRLAIQDVSSEVTVWDIKENKTIYTFKAPEEKDEEWMRGFSVVRFSKDDKTLYIGGMKGKIFRYDLTTGKELEALPAHIYWVTHLSISKDGRTLHSAAWDGSIRRWDVQTGKPLPDGDGYVWASLEVLPNGRQILVGDMRGRLDLWDLKERKKIKAFQESGIGIRRLTLHPDGKQVVTMQVDGHIQFWDLATGKARKKHKLGEESNMIWDTSVFRFTTDGKYLFCSAGMQQMQLWDIAKEKSVWTQNSGPGTAAAVSLDGKRVVQGDPESGLIFRDGKDGSELFRGQPQRENNGNEWGFQIASDLCFSPDGNLVASAHYDSFVRLWDTRNGRQIKSVRIKGEYGNVSISHDNRWLLTSSVTGCQLWDCSTGKELLDFKGVHGAFMRNSTFLLDGKTFLLNANSSIELLSLRPKDVPKIESQDEVWNQLGSNDGLKVFRATWQVIESAHQMCSYFQEKIPTVKLEDPERINRMIRDLDSPRFAVREAAMRNLNKLGPSGEPALRVALQKNPSPELQDRLQRLLDMLRRDPTPDELRVLRIIGALEKSAAPEAKALLTTWASGASGARLTEESKAALNRMKQLQ